MIVQTILRDAQPVTLDAPVPNGDCDGLWVGSGGDLDLTLVSGTRVTFAGVSAGFFGAHIKQVNSAGTTATRLLAVYI
jgi:hypothetical protein